VAPPMPAGPATGQGYGQPYGYGPYNPYMMPPQKKSRIKKWLKRFAIGAGAIGGLYLGSVGWRAAQLKGKKWNKKSYGEKFQDVLKGDWDKLLSLFGKKQQKKPKSTAEKVKSGVGGFLKTIGEKVKGVGGWFKGIFTGGDKKKKKGKKKQSKVNKSSKKSTKGSKKPDSGTPPETTDEKTINQNNSSGGSDRSDNTAIVEEYLNKRPQRKLVAVASEQEEHKEANLSEEEKSILDEFFSM